MVVFLAFVGPTFNHISRVLSKHDIKTLGFLSRKVIIFDPSRS